MESWLVFFSAAVLFSCMISASHSDPQEYRKCGDSLANMMAMVCKGRGYNSLYSKTESLPNQRKRRGIGIVDECCRSSCSLSTILQYCGPLTTESPVNTQIRKRSDSEDWAVETNSEGTEVLTFRPKSVEVDDARFRKHLYGIGSERRHPVDLHAGISNAIQKQSASDVEEKTSHENSGNALQQLMKKLRGCSGKSRSNEERRSSKEEKKSSKEKGTKCNSVTGCRGSGKSRDISSIDRRDLDARRPSSIDKLAKSNERSSSEQNRIRHRNHKNSSRERKTSNEEKPRQSQVGTLTPFYQQKGLVQPIFKSPRLNLR